jgi:hypothetical protein
MCSASLTGRRLTTCSSSTHESSSSSSSSSSTSRQLLHVSHLNNQAAVEMLESLQFAASCADDHQRVCCYDSARMTG